MSRPRLRRERPRVIAPRLANGLSRESIGHGLPPHIKDGLRAIALAENESMSWVLEKVIIRYFGLEKPEYIKRRTVNEREGLSQQKGRVIPHRPGLKKRVG